MRIVYLLNSLGVGGAERQTLALAERIARCGNQVAILTLRGRMAEEWETPLAVHRLGMRQTPLSFVACLLPARRFLREFRPNVIHSHSFHSNLFARLLKLLVPRVKVVSTVHTEYERGWGRMAACRMTDALARRTVFVSQAAADRFVRMKVVAGRRCSVMSNAIDVAEFAPDAARRGRMRAEIGLGPEFAWLAAGRIAPAKDYPNLLRALAEVRRCRPDVRLLVAGDAVDTEGARAQALATELGLGDAAVFLGLRRDLPALLDAADGFVLSSAWEGMPLALAEAMAMEKPVVATDVGGVRELIGDAGVIVPPQDPMALANAMLVVMEQPADARRAQGGAARRRIVEKFDIEQRARDWLALYGEVLWQRN